MAKNPLYARNRTTKEMKFIILIVTTCLLTGCFHRIQIKDEDSAKRAVFYYLKNRDPWFIYQISSDSGVGVRRIFGKTKEKEYVLFVPPHDKQDGFGDYVFSKKTILKCALAKSVLGKNSSWILNSFEQQFFEAFESEMESYSSVPVKLSDLEAHVVDESRFIYKSGSKDIYLQISIFSPDAGAPYNFYFLKDKHGNYKLEKFM